MAEKKVIPRPTSFSWVSRYSGWALGLIIFASVVKLFIAGWYNLSGDEAYYWLWSRNLDWSYFSKGPGIAWAIALGTGLCGDTAFGVRWLSVLFVAGAGVMIFRLTAEMFGERAGFWAVVVAMLVPLFAVGGIVMTIDSPSVFFWALAAWLFWKNRESLSIWSWVPAGLAVGAGILFKYTNAFELLCFTVFLLWSDKRRGEFARPRFWLLLLAALLCLFPIVIWNQQNDWITVKHLIQKGKLDQPTPFTFEHTIDFVLGQILIFNPFFALGWLAAVFTLFRAGVKTDRFRYLLSLTLPLLIFYGGLSLHSKTEMNWAAQSFVTAIPLLVIVWLGWLERSLILRGVARGALILSAVLILLAHTTLFLPNLQGLIQIVKPSLSYDPIRRIKGWKNLGEQVAEIQQQEGVTFIIANKYTIASLVSFYHPEHIQTFIPAEEGRKNQFSYWPSYRGRYPGESAIYISESDSYDPPPPELAAEFLSVEALPPIFSYSGGKRMYKFYLFLLREQRSTKTLP